MAELSGLVCLVTGASRGIGKGIALQLGKAGATVYITGRTLKPKEGAIGSLQETADEITAASSSSGKCVPIQCDHSVDADIKNLFDRISKEQDGQLDLLVNNAYAGVETIFNNMKSKFWEQPLETWDTINNVGLRNNYMCSVYAAKLMVPRGKGLMINISSFGGAKYLFNVAYGVGKAAKDRMAADCAFELKKHNVAYLSIWPGAVRTEMVGSLSKSADSSMGDSQGDGARIRRMFEQGETIEYTGACIVKLLKDENIMKKSGRTIMSSDLASEYNVVDVDGRSPPHVRSVSTLLASSGWTTLSSIVPAFIKVPYWVIALATSKF